MLFEVFRVKLVCYPRDCILCVCVCMVCTSCMLDITIIKLCAYTHSHRRTLRYIPQQRDRQGETLQVQCMDTVVSRFSFWRLPVFRAYSAKHNALCHTQEHHQGECSRTSAPACMHACVHAPPPTHTDAPSVTFHSSAPGKVKHCRFRAWIPLSADSSFYLCRCQSRS